MAQVILAQWRSPSRIRANTDDCVAMLKDDNLSRPHFIFVPTIPTLAFTALPT